MLGVISVFSRQRRCVWVVGHSIVHWASEYAASSGWGSNLGLSERLQIFWMGRRGMRWPALLPTIKNGLLHSGTPHAIIIQLGENDLLAEKGFVLSRTIISDLSALHELLPGMMLIWSGLLECKEWRGALAPDRVDFARKKVYKVVSSFVHELGGQCIMHPDISFRLSALYHRDGVHLSEWGMDLWLHRICQSLIDWLQA